MSLVIELPQSLVVKLKKLGVDVESIIVELLAKYLNMDPKEEALVHLELAKRYFIEGSKLVDKDPVQASEKLYKVAEECIKAMALSIGLEEAEAARTQGKWTLRLLDNAAKKLSDKIDERIYDDWGHAYFLHVEGFHEARLDSIQVRNRIMYIEELLKISDRVLKNIMKEK